MAQGPKLAAGYYLLAFIDVLGQRDLLRKMHDLPEKNNEKQMAEFVALLKKTVGIVTGMRNLFLDYFKGSSLEHFKLSEFNPEQQKILKQAKSNPLKSHMFSDFVILFLPLRDDVNKVPVSGVYSVLGAIASTFLAMLASGHAIRGGIDVGVGIELSDDEIYGAALARAYQLETRIAQYPRVVLGDTFITYLQSKLSTTSKDFFSEANKKVAELCTDLIAIDTDGLPFVDYLGQAFKQYIAKNMIYDLAEKAYHFIMKESIRCQKLKDSRLAFRYALLRNYFEARMHIWSKEGHTDETRNRHDS